jgi:glycosyltransferase involved in cell wall biosynthesis
MAQGTGPRILVFAYHFPPMGGAGAQRAIKLVRRLAELGWEPVVVTREGGADERYNPRDEQLVTELPTGLEVHRVPGPEPDLIHGNGWSSRVERLVGRVDARARWWAAGAERTALAIGGRFDLVHAFLEPYETATAATAVAGRLGIPWIADLQDPWALDEVRVQITRLHAAQDRRRMRRGLRTAAAVVMNTGEAARAVVRELPEFRGGRVHSIPNGFDAREWSVPPAERSDGAFRIVHTGTLHTAIGLAHRRSAKAHRVLGGRLAEVDMLTRSHVFLLEALDSLIADRPELAGRIELHLAGLLTDADLAAAAGRAYVRPRGFLSHADTVELIRSADLLFLPMHDLPPGTPARIVPCKTYEYLASERPMLAAVPDGDARELLTRSPGVHVCRPADVAAMRAAVEAELDAPQAAPARAERRALLARYERDALTDELMRVFAEALGRRGPGAAAERAAALATT